MLISVVPKVGITVNNPFKNAEFLSMIKRFVPLVVGVSVVDFGHLIDKIVASSLESGSVSALYYGQVISSDIVNAVIITSVGAVLLASISRSVASKVDHSALIKQIQSIMCTMTFISGCLSALYFVEGQDLIRAFFERGSFNNDNTFAVSSIASFYAAGFIFMANREILIKTHFAFHDTVSPMINSLAGVVINLIGSIVLSRSMGVAGIALATSISLLTVFIMSLFTLKKHIDHFIIDKACGMDFLKTAVCMGITTFGGKMLSAVLQNAHFMIRMCSVGILMVIVYVVLGLLVKEKTIKEFLFKFKAGV
jgi:putative peptidoglycan lipid II flippase